MSYPDNASLIAGHEGREYVRQRNARGSQQQFPDHASYLRYLSGVSYVQNQRRAAPIPFTEPLNVTVTADVGSARVAFDAPASTGGGTVVSYTITVTPGNIKVVGTTSPITVPGLTSGQTYSFVVTASNGKRTSAPSPITAPVMIATPPSAPSITVARGNAKLTVTVTPPTTDGGSAITGYKYSVGDGDFQATPTITNNQFDITGLTNGIPYSVRLLAVNAVGDSDPSTAVSGTPATVPTAPSITVARGNAKLTITVTTPADGGSAITGYKYSVGDGDFQATPTITNNEFEIIGLTNGTQYSVRLLAVNAVGDSDPSTAVSGIPLGRPLAPTISVASTVSKLVVSVTPPSDNGGSPITGYKYSLNGGNFEPVTLTNGQFELTGLTNGNTYDVSVLASNAEGDGPGSTPPTEGKPVTVPDAPSIVVTRGNTTLTVTVTPPAFDGGSAITGYKYSVTDNGAFQAIQPNSNGLFEITGLTNGTLYSVRFLAVNAQGDGSASSSATGTPATVPDAPTGVSGARGDKKVTVTFTAPANNGGAAITGYTVSAYDGSTLATSATGTTLSIDVPNLKNGTAYTFTVVATNDAGDSTPSAASAEVTPVDPSTLVPLAPTSLAISARTTTSLTITFTQPSNNTPPVTNYKYSLDGATPVALSPADASSPVTITGLTPKTIYSSIQLIAVNTNGDSPLSDPVSGTTYANIHYARFLDVGAHTWTAPAGVTEVEYLIVGGGGGGGGSFSNIKVLGNIPFTASDPNPASANTYYIRDMSGTGASTSATTGHGYLRKDSSNNTDVIFIQATAPIEIVPNFGRANYPNSVANIERWKPFELVYFFNGSGFGSVTSPAWAPPGESISSTYNNNISAGSGGGGGGHIRTSAINPFPKHMVIPGQTYNIYVGAGGKGGTATPGTGSGIASGNGTETSGEDGETSSFDTLAAPGGAGGKYSRTGYRTNGGGGASSSDILGGRGGAGGGRNGGAIIDSSVYTYRATLEGAPGNSGISLNFDGTGNTNYTSGGDGGDPNKVSTTLALPNTGKGGKGTGAPLNGAGNGRPGASGLVILKYYTDGNVTASAPTAAITPGNRKLTVTVTPPTSDGGSPITGYKYSLDGGNFQDAPPLSPSNQFDITGLTNTVAYSVRILAVNAQGIGAPSAAVSGTPVGQPDAPTNVSGTPGNKKAIIDFDAPTNNGGEEIISYTVSAYSGSTLVTSASGAASPIEVTGLTNGTAYTFKVTATNIIGTSDPSTASAAVTPSGLTREIFTTGSGTWTVPAGVTAVEYLIVGGGGGGGGGSGTGAGGGGGGGSVKTGTLSVSSGANLLYTVGDGGAGGVGSSGGESNGANGNNSIFGSIIAAGGGLGYKSRQTNSSNAYGKGGNSQNGDTPTTGGSGGNVRDGQGNPDQGAGGGGGGAGGAGADSTSNGSDNNRGGAGGAGITSTLQDDTNREYGKGGKGADEGTSSFIGTQTGASGAANTGNGGGGGASHNMGGNGAPGGAGGSGIIVLKYTLP